MRVPPVNAWLSPADVGRRVTVRRQTVTGLRDTVGNLVAWTAGPTGTLQVEGRDGVIVDLKTTEITAARVVPPEISALRLQVITEAAWPVSDHEALGDWMLRFAGGEARRTNSARITGVPSGDVHHALDYITEWYERRGIRAQVQTPAPGAFDQVLMDKGWEPFSESYFMVRDSAEGGTVAENVHVASSPSNDWLTVAAPDMARGLAAPMALAQHQRFITVYDGETPVSVGRVVGHEGWGIVTTVRTAADEQRKGYGRTCMDAVHSAARDMGSKAFMLQVLVENEKAVPLYNDLGYYTHHHYRYFLAP